MRRFTQFSHTERMMEPQFVKRYVKSNDAVDAEAICEVVERLGMRFVPAVSSEQQNIQSLHRICIQLARITEQTNQICGLLLEYGLILGHGMNQVRKSLPEIFEDGENTLSPLFRKLLIWCVWINGLRR